jgi:3-deoxy-D-manno-octulosonic-acid transferase
MRILLIFILYQLLQIITLPLLGIYLSIRRIKKKSAFGNLKERLGIVPSIHPVCPQPIWIHAVSVGEILSIQNLVDQIKEKKNAKCYVTTGTPTGKNIAQKNLNANQISFLPFDFLPSMLLAFKRIKPSAIIVVEAETWPNFLILAKWLRIPIYSLNARISKRSESKYQKLKFIFKPLFNIFTKIFVQSKEDKTNFEKLGIDTNKLSVLGNIKALNVLAKIKSPHTSTNTKQAVANKKNITSPLILSDFTCKTNKIVSKNFLVGSLHPGELDIHLNNFIHQKKNNPNLKLIIAPRHFHWKEELINKVKKTDFSFYCWNENSDKVNIAQVLQSNDILLVCKLGELFGLYQYCNIFFLGGTFVPVGGHNLLEPAVWAKPSIIGPYYQNCKDIANKLEQHKALIKAKNLVELSKQTEKLLLDLNKLEKMSTNAQAWLQNEARLVENNLNILIKEIQN